MDTADKFFFWFGFFGCISGAIYAAFVERSYVGCIGWSMAFVSNLHVRLLYTWRARDAARRVSP